MAAVALQCGREGEDRPQSFTAVRRTRSGVQLGPRKGGEQGSTVSSSGGQQWQGGDAVLAQGRLGSAL
jgi:hypothetical protein